MTFDYAAFKTEFRRGKRDKRRKLPEWLDGRFWAQDSIEELGASAAEYTTLPWRKRGVEDGHGRSCPYEPAGREGETLPLEELILTRRLLVQAGQDLYIQDVLREVFAELAAEAPARDLPKVYRMRREITAMVVAVPA